ncbi:MAG: hypothetical protein FWD63_05680 [Propionibacteriaceae bacterium]|nr:hypothetical protein [Propionibacteriaceae bacterium]
MPVTGRKPKPAGQAVTRHPLQHDFVEVEDRPNPHPRRLPAKRPSGGDWPAETKTWWQAVAAMPHSVLWSESDWAYALETAEVSARFYADGNTQAATELRNRDKVLGLTWDSRRGLRIRYVPKTVVKDEIGGVGNVTRLDDYRNL